jgi:hypothetical protein
MTREEFFWKHVHKSEGCWEWTGCLVRGYGQFRITDHHRNRRIYAHRFSYELAFGRIGADVSLDHKCRNHRLRCWAM